MGHVYFYIQHIWFIFSSKREIKTLKIFYTIHQFSKLIYLYYFSYYLQSYLFSDPKDFILVFPQIQIWENKWNRKYREVFQMMVVCYIKILF